MGFLAEMRAIVGDRQVLVGADAGGYGREWTRKYHWQPMAVVRPGSTAEVAAVVRAVTREGHAVVPVGGNTGLTGATYAEGAVMVSLERMNRIEAVNPDARTAIVEGGVVVAALHAAADSHDLVFPLSFGARGSAMIGGCLATNAGGSNVLRYGSTRGLCLGIEAVLADGRVLDLMMALHKDNSGYALKDLFIGSEGTLGIITRAVLKLFPKPRAYATALVAMHGLAPALALLNRLQEMSGGGVEAFEYMPDLYAARLARYRPDLAFPFPPDTPATILVEIGATAPLFCGAGTDGTIPLANLLEDALAEAIAAGEARDAVIATTGDQRAAFWARREAAAEITLTETPIVDTDVAVPLDRVETFLGQMRVRLAAIDPAARDMVVAHLGDGNLHYTAYPSRDDPALAETIRAAVDAVATALGGSFSAEHGVGLSKRAAMARHKDPVALDLMRAVKRSFDPADRMNPGKLLP
jgi:FAD/FMN-containing dehydrogenase